VARKERYLVGLDIGTSKTTAIVAEPGDNASLNIVGMGVAESNGIRRGLVVNLEAAVESIKKAIVEAELTAGIEIDNVHLALCGPHVKGFNSRGVVAVSGKNREITHEDVGRAIDAAKAVSLPAGRQILHVLPQDFVVDDQDGIRDPVGMQGARLEVNVHVVTGSVTATQNIIACANRGGVTVKGTVLGQLAASDAVLTEDEKELGVALLDIGGGTTDLAIFERGSLWHTAVIPVGGDHFTNDIAVGLRMPIPDAEKLKRRSGCALSAMVEDEETIEVASVGGRRPRVMGRRILTDVLQPRAEEIFHLVWDEIRHAGYEKALNSGIVLTGGGAILDGLPEIAEQIFDLPIRRGCPVGVAGGLVDHVNSPAFATAVGLTQRAHAQWLRETPAGGSGPLSRTMGRLGRLFREFFAW
jgi:cell division protein FtsA